MSDTWISTTPESDDYVRLAKLSQFEDGVASFTIYDVRLGPVEDFHMKTVSDGSAHAPPEDVPDQYDSMDIFRVVPPEDGEFIVSSLARFTNQREKKDHIIGLLFDPDLNDKYQTYLNQL